MAEEDFNVRLSLTDDMSAGLRQAAGATQQMGNNLRTLGQQANTASNLTVGGVNRMSRGFFSLQSAMSQFGGASSDSFGKMSQGMKAATQGLTTISTSLMAGLGPWGLVIAAIGAASVALSYFTEKNKEAAEMQRKVLDAELKAKDELRRSFEKKGFREAEDIERRAIGVNEWEEGIRRRNIQLAELKEKYAELFSVLKSNEELAPDAAARWLSARETALRNDDPFGLEAANAEWENFNAALESNRKGLEKIGDEIHETAVEHDLLSTELANRTRREKELNKVQKTALDIERERAEAIKAMSKTFEGGLQVALMNIREEIFNFARAFEGAFRSIEGSFSSAIENMVLDGKSFENAMQDIARSIVRSFVRMGADIMASEFFRLIIGGGGGGGIGGLAGAFAGGAGGAMAGGGGDMAGGMTGQIPGAEGATGAAAAGATGLAAAGPAFGIGAMIAGAAAFGPAAIRAPQSFLAGDTEGTGRDILRAGPLGGSFLATVAASPLGIAMHIMGRGKKDDAESKAKKAASAAAAAQAEEYRLEGERMAGELEELVRAQYGGGLTTPEQMEALSGLLSGGITGDEARAFGTPEEISERLDEVTGGSVMNNIDVNAPITVNASIATDVDVDALARSLGLRLTEVIEGGIPRTG